MKTLEKTYFAVSVVGLLLLVAWISDLLLAVLGDDMNSALIFVSVMSAWMIANFFVAPFLIYNHMRRETEVAEKYSTYFRVAVYALSWLLFVYAFVVPFFI